MRRGWGLLELAQLLLAAVAPQATVQEAAEVGSLQRRELQRTATGVRVSGSETVDFLHNAQCVDDPTGFLEHVGLGCSGETMHMTEEECEQAGFMWQDDDDNSNLHHCWRSDLQNLVRMKGCSGWFLGGMYTVADLCPFTCYGCEESVPFDALNRLFLDLRINAPDISLVDIAGAKGQGGLVPTISLGVQSLSCYDVSMGNLLAETVGPERRPGVLLSGAQTAKQDEVTLTISASNVMFTCQIDFQWCMFSSDASHADGTDLTCATGDPALSGSSTVEINTAQAEIEVDLVLSSPNLTVHPPCLPAGTGYARSQPEQACTGKFGTLQPRRTFSNNSLLPAYAEGGIFQDREPFCRMDFGTMHEIYASGGGFTDNLINFVQDFGWPWSWGEGDFLQEYIVCPDCALVQMLKNFVVKEVSSFFNDELGGMFESLSASIEPYVNPDAASYLCKQGDAPCREEKRFRGPEGMTRGQRWPEGDALQGEEALLRDPRVAHSSLLQEHCGSNPGSEGYIWIDGTCRKPLMTLADSWVVQFVNESIRGIVGRATDPPTEISLAEDGSWDPQAVNDLFSNIELGPLQMGVLNLTELAVAAGKNIATEVSTKWTGNYTVRADKDNITLPEAKINDARAVNINTSITVESLTVSGFNNFTRFDPVQFIGRYSLGSGFALDELQMDAALTLTITAPDGVGGALEHELVRNGAELINGFKVLKEPFTLHASLKDLSIDFAVMLALNKNSINALTVGELLDPDLREKCVTSTIELADVTKLELKFADVEEPLIGGLVSAGFDQFIQQLVHALFVTYKDVGSTALHNAMQTSIRQWINDKISTYINDPVNRDCSANTVDSFGPSGKFPWYFKLNDSLERYGLIGMSSPLAYAQAAITTFLSAMHDDREPYETLVAKGREALETSGYKDSEILYVHGLDSVVTEPAPDVLVASGEASSTARIIDEPTSLHSHVTLQTILAAAYYRYTLPLTPQEIEVDWTSQQMAMCTSAGLMDFDASDIGLTFDFDLRIPNIKLHSLRLVDLLNTDCWMQTLERFAASGSIDVGRVRHLNVSCDYHDDTQTSCSAMTREAEDRAAAFGTVEKNHLASLISDGVSTVMKLSAQSLEFCEKSVADTSDGDDLECPLCPKWMEEVADPVTGLAICTASTGWIEEDCETLKRVADELREMMYGDLDELVASDAWLQAERTLPHDDSTRYLDLNLTFIVDVLSTDISEVVSKSSFDTIHVDNPFAAGPISLVEPDQGRVVNLTLSEMGTVPISILPGQGLNLSLDTLDIAMGPISSVHVLQMCPDSPECSRHGFSLGSTDQPGRYTLWHTATLERLELAAGASVTKWIESAEDTCCVPESIIGIQPGHVCMEDQVQTDRVQVNMTIHNVTAIAATMVAINVSELERQKLAPLFSKHEESVISCALISLSSTALTSSWASVSDVSAPDITITGLPLQSPASTVLSSFAGAAVCIANPILNQYLPRLLGNACYQDTFNNGAKWYLEKMHRQCNTLSTDLNSDLGFQRGSVKLLNFTALLAKHGNAGTAADEHDYCTYPNATSTFLEDELLERDRCPDTGIGCKLWSKVEQIVTKDVLPWNQIRCAFQTATIPDLESGWPPLVNYLMDALDGYRTEQPLSISGSTVKVMVEAITFGGLARGYNVSMLRPVNDSLRTEFTIGTPAEPFEMKVDMQVGTTSESLLQDLAHYLLERQDQRFALATQNEIMTNHNFTLTLSAHGVHAFVDAALGLDLQKLSDMVLAQVSNLQCWDSVFEYMNIFWGLDLGTFSAAVECHGDSCHCNDAAAHTEVQCAAAGSCEWNKGQCKPDWLTSIKKHWDESIANLRFKENLEHIIDSLSNLVNEPVFAASDEFVKIRDYATDLYTSLGAFDVTAPMTDSQRDDILIAFEQLVVQKLDMNGVGSYNLLNLNADGLLKYVQDALLPNANAQTAVVRSLLENALPGGNITVPVNIPLHMSLSAYSIDDGKTWFQKLVEGAYSFTQLLESQESQDWILESVTLTGLDSLQNVSMFQPSEGRLTLLNQVAFQRIGVLFNITVNRKIEQPPEEYNVWWSCVKETVEETSTIVIGTHITNVEVQAATLLALDLDTLFDTQLGQILHQPLGCALSAVKEFNLSFTDIRFAKHSQIVPYFNVSGNSLSPAGRTIMNVVRGIEALLQPLLRQHLPEVLNTIIPVLVTDTVSSWLEENAQCPAVSQKQVREYPDGTTRPQTIDFLNNPLYRKLHQLIDTHKSEIQRLLGDLALGMTTKHAPCPEEVNGISLNGNCSGVLIMMRDNVPEEESLHITTGAFQLQISDVILTGLNTLGEDLEILDPISEHRLNTTVLAGNIQASAHVLLRLNHGAELDLDLPITYDDFYISIDTDAIRVVLGLILEIKTHELWELTLNNLNIEDCWRSVLRDKDFDLYELALNFGLDPTQELNLNVHCLSCHSSTLRRIAASLQEPGSGSKLGSSLNNIFDAFTTSVVSGTGFNLPHQACKDINGNTSIILEDVLSLRPLVMDSSVATKTYAAINENDFKTDPKRGGAPNLHLVNLRCDKDVGCSFDGLKTGAAGLVAFGLDRAQKVVNAGLVETINKAIKAATCTQPPCWEYYIELDPVLLRDSTQSLPRHIPEAPLWPDSAVHFLDGWVQESGEKWELTGVRLKSLHSVKSASVAKPLNIPEQDGTDETYTLWNEISMGEIVVELNISVVTQKVAAPFTCNSNDEFDRDTVLITTGARDLHIGIATLLAIDEDKMNALQAGQFFNDSLSCLASTIHSFEVTAANFSIGSLITPTMEKDMNFGKMEHLILGLVGPAICVAQPVLNMVAELALGPADGEINLREITNGLIKDQLDTLASKCEPLSGKPPHFFDPFLNFKTAEAKIPFSNKLVNIMEEVSQLINDTVRPQTINNLMSDGRWDYTRTEEQIRAQNHQDTRDQLCNKPCDVKDLELCWGNWGGPGDPFYQPNNRTCSALMWQNGTTGVGYEREMYSNSCGRSCSTDPKMFFEFFKRPQNSSVTGKKIPDKVGVLGEMVIEISNVHATGLESLVHDLQLLDVVDRYTIGNYARLFVESPLMVSMDVKVGISGMKDSLHSTEWPPVGLDTDFTVTISAKEVELALEFVLQIRDRVRSLELVDFFNEDCAIRIVEDMLPTLLKMDIGQVGLDVKCKKCTPKLLELQNLTSSVGNLAQLTDIINAFIERYADHFEVAHDASGSLMHTAEDRRESDEHMRSLIHQWLWKRQGLSEVRTGAAVVDGDLEYFGQFEVTTPADKACKGLVHRTSALEEVNITSCGELVIPYSTYGDVAMLDSMNVSSFGKAGMTCSGLGQECTYRCQTAYHLQDRALFDRIGTVRCQDNGEYTEIIPCVHFYDSAVAWWESTQDSLGTEVLVVAGVVIGLVFTWCCTRKRRKMFRRVSCFARCCYLVLCCACYKSSQDEEHHTLAQVPKKGDGNGTGQGHRSLLKNRNLPRWVRLYVPIVLMINVGFFVMGHIYTAASVDIVLKLFGREVRIDGIVTMSLGNTLKDMLAAPNPPWPLIILLGGMSGVWPYTKLTLICSCWILPPSRLRPKKRGQLLMTLDALGKWSLIDLYVMLFFMLAFRVNMTNPSLAVLPSGLWSGDLKLTAVWGLFAFTIAVISSLIVNNLAIHYHRNALVKEHSANLLRSRESALVAEHQAQNEERDRAHSILRRGPNKTVGYTALDASVEDTGVESESEQSVSGTSWYSAGTEDVEGVRKSLIHSREALCNHVFSLEHYEVWFPIGGRTLVTLLLGASIALTICGAYYYESFAVNCYGIGAAGMNFGTPGSSVKQFTVFTSFTYIMGQADADETQEVRNGIYALAYSYIVFAVIIPLLQQVGLLILWTVPLTLRRQKLVFFTIEVLHGWASMPVFLLGLMVSILEVGMLSGSLIPKNIAPMDLLRLLQSWDIISETDADAGLMQITMEPRFGLYLLVAACACEYLGATIVVRCGEVCIDEREWRISGRPPNEEQEMGCGKPIMNKLLQGTTCCGIPVSPGLRYMPRLFVKRHNLSKLLLSGGAKNSSLSAEDQLELFQKTALLNPMDGVEKAGVAITADLRRRMTTRDDFDGAPLDGRSESTRDGADHASSADNGYGSDTEMQSWRDSMAFAMAEATVTQWRTVAGTRTKSKLGSVSSSGRAATSLPPGWTTTMWQGEVYYWNCITGQTTSTPPGERQTPTPRERWQQATARVTAEAVDIALEERVRHREGSQSFEESMALSEVDVESNDEQIGLGIVRPPRNPPLFGVPKQPFATYSWSVAPD